MGTAVVLLATLLFAWCAVLLLVRSAFRAVRRQAGRLSDRARSAALTHGSGPAAEAARLRRDMDRSLAGARRALAAAKSIGAPTGDSRLLLGRLQPAAPAVGGQPGVLL